MAEAPLDAWAPRLAAEKPSEGLHLFVPLLVVFVVVAVVFHLRRKLLRRYVRDRAVEMPTFSRRVTTAVMIGVARGLLPALIFGVPLVVVLLQASQRGIAGDMFVAALVGTTFVILVYGLARATLAPFSLAVWRMVPLTDASSLALFR